ncbi:putative ATP-dependent RNA helicase [Trypanosoma grayi]|uniref:putative ATP-dependent RNA helicase n=1 Tax=Trypanosoma grayi TaxID=71804 RepID=UPI0004F4B5FA|nr:putative ATP-dependent RNA helicase [Trypanosoma grayi]KEG15503.1 putative ATP-dependent RNA helicase [Trypanosoma grayi]
MPPKRSISFLDLGLSTPVPHVLSSTREQKKKEKHEIKKEKNARLKEAEEQLSLGRAKVEKHKAFVKKEVAIQKDEKTARRKALSELQEHLRKERETEEYLKKQKSIVTQQNYISNLAADREAEEKRMQEIKETIESSNEKLAKMAPKNVHIPVTRSPEIEKTRKELPVLREEQVIVEAINNSSRTCVLICGETGSGKTTQIPQFLWECGYGDLKGSPFAREGAILVTEPRRVAAVSMAKRVAEELGTTFGENVCYHVRYDNNLSDSFKMKFATEGIVLKEIQSDFLLRRYSVVVVDEAHERSVAGDILIGLLSRIVPLRNDLYLEELQKHKGIPEKTTVKPLKLVIMSATMRVADFKENRRLFPIPPPLISVEARRFPVTNHFAKRTELRDYVHEAFRKVCQIHKKLPPGGILIFLSTQQEIESLCECLRQHYAKTRIEYYDKSYSKHSLIVRSAQKDDTASENDEESSGEKDEFGLKNEDYALDMDTETGASFTSRKRDRNALDTKKEEEEEVYEEDEINGEYNSMHILPLYALMDFRKQQEVFREPPTGKRLCVVATNVAETSITIPNIRYVVDVGRVKMKTVDESTGASCFRIEWTSQASAEQRSGRAGRVGPGHCYRLYSTAVYSNVMPKHSSPEILRTSLESVVLMMKHLGIDHVGSFPFPSPPKESDLKRALSHLSLIGALDSQKDHRITNMGKRLIAYPIPPRFSRVIAEALDQKVSESILSMAILIVSIYSTTTSVFTREGNSLKWKSVDANTDSEESKTLIQSLLHPGSDLLTCLKAFGVYLNDPSVANCRRHCLVQKSLLEASQLGEQLRVLSRQDGIVEQVDDTLDANDVGTANCEKLFGDNGLLTLSKDQEVALRKLFIFGLVDQVARRATIQECRYHGVEYKDNKTTKAPYVILDSSMIAYIHPTSSIARTYPPPEYVTFAFLQRSVRSETKDPSTMMLGLTIVTKEWLHECGVTVE